MKKGKKFDLSNYRYAAIVLISVLLYEFIRTLKENILGDSGFTSGALGKDFIGPSCFSNQSRYLLPAFSKNNFTNVLQRCAAKMIGHSRRNKKEWQISFDDVCLHSPGTAHKPDRISDGCKAQRFAWKRDCIEENARFYISAAEDLNTASIWEFAGCKVVLVLEPPAVMPHSPALIQQYYNSADIILSSYNIDNDPEGKVFPFVYGSTWISEDERCIYRKKRGTSIIASSKQETTGHKLRHAIIARYASRFGIDVFGRLYNPVDRKVQALADYRYSIIIENSQTEYYITEKLIDAFLTGTIPIYWGASEVSKIFDCDGILAFKDETDFSRVIGLATPEYYVKKRAAILRNYEIALNYRCPEERLYSDFFNPLFDVISSQVEV